LDRYNRFAKVADALADELTPGEELGAPIAVDIDGEMVVDIWGGHCDRAKTTPGAQNTIVNFFRLSRRQLRALDRRGDPARHR
jgi:hypothetical protein